MGSFCSNCGGESPEPPSRQNNMEKTNLINKDATPNGGEAEPGNVGSYDPNKPQDIEDVPNLYSELARFMRTLPEQSKKRIWKHSVKRLEQTSKVEHVVALLSDCVIVYIKWLDQKRPQLHPDDVKPKVEKAAKWIVDTYTCIEKDEFIMSSKYWPDKLEAYEQHRLNNPTAA
jgi:hypothetical protein